MILSPFATQARFDAPLTLPASRRLTRRSVVFMLKFLVHDVGWRDPDFMEHSLTRLRNAARWLGPPLLLLLSAVLVLGSMHHHATLGDHDACVVCTAAHAPAMTPASAPALQAPIEIAPRPLPPLYQPYARRVSLRPSPRAPPLV